jgi:hypothetical protein
MIADLNRKKKFEKVIDLRNPMLPEDFLRQKAMTNKLPKETLDLDLNQACKFW